MKTATTDFIRQIAKASVLFPQDIKVGEETPMVFFAANKVKDGMEIVQGLVVMKVVKDDVFPGSPARRVVVFEGANVGPDKKTRERHLWYVNVVDSYDEGMTPAWEGKVTSIEVIEAEVSNVR